MIRGSRETALGTRCHTPALVRDAPRCPTAVVEPAPQLDRLRLGPQELLPWGQQDRPRSTPLVLRLVDLRQAADGNLRSTERSLSLFRTRTGVDPLYSVSRFSLSEPTT